MFGIEFLELIKAKGFFFRFPLLLSSCYFPTATYPGRVCFYSCLSTYRYLPIFPVLVYTHLRTCGRPDLGLGSIGTVDSGSVTQVGASPREYPLYSVQCLNFQHSQEVLLQLITHVHGLPYLRGLHTAARSLDQ